MEFESIAETINIVLTNEQQYDTMKRNALEVAKIFNWENESKKLLEIYRRSSHRLNDRTA